MLLRMAVGLSAVVPAVLHLFAMQNTYPFLQPMQSTNPLVHFAAYCSLLGALGLITGIALRPAFWISIVVWAYYQIATLNVLMFTIQRSYLPGYNVSNSSIMMATLPVFYPLHLPR